MSICSMVAARRWTGSATPTGNSAMMADTWLLAVRSPAARTETGTSERRTTLVDGVAAGDE